MFESNAAADPKLEEACLEANSKKVALDDSNSPSENLMGARWDDAVKRVMDICGASVLLILLSPVLLIIALVVMSDHGNAVYGHPRIGRGGRTFKCLKFRSMVKNSDEVLAKLLATDPQARAEWDRDFKLKTTFV